MKILHVVPTYLPATRYGGPIYSVHGLCRALVRRKHEVHVYTTNIDGKASSTVPIDNLVDLDGVQISYFRSPFLRRLCWSPAMGSALKERIHDFDCVHLHSVFLWPTWMAARTAWQSGVPYVLAPRGMLVKQLIRRKSRWVKQAWIYLIEQKNIQRAAALHVTSQIEEAELRHFDFPLPPVELIPNGVDFETTWSEPVISREMTELPCEQPMVLYLGRVNWKKGLDRLIPALVHTPYARLVVAGNDEEHYLPVLEKLARQNGVRERVKFVGPVHGADKSSLLASAKVLVLPSYSENFGNVVMEAMAAACPVIVTKGVGLASVVEQARCGVVSDGEPAKLGCAISSLLADEAKRIEMGNRGAELVRERYTWDIVAEQMESLYRMVIAAKHPS